MMVFSVAVTLFLALVMLFYSTLKYTKEIIEMALCVKKHNYSRPIVLRKTGIAEIDELANALEIATTEVIASGERLSITMDLVDAKIGCFEHNLKTNRVFLTDSLFRLLEISKDDTYDNLITVETWNKIIGDWGYQLEFEYKAPGTNTVKWLSAKTVLNDKKIFGIIMDITKEVYERKRLEEERDYDILTGLYNRRAFQTLVSKAMLANPKSVAALMFLDLDNLKYVNDVYGHDIGDKYIKSVADNIRQFQLSNAIVSRISGDEFAIYIHSCSSKEEIRNTIKQRINEFNSSLRLPDNSVQKIRMSTGISYYPSDSNNFSDLMKFADFAMYEVKHSYKGRIKEFDRVSYDKNYYLLDKSEALNDLIENKLVYFDFQPVVEVKSAEVIGYEALMRPTCIDFETPYEVLNTARTHAKLYEIEKLTIFSVLEYIKKNSSDLGDKKMFLNSISNQELSDDDINDIKINYLGQLSSVIVEFTEEEKINLKNKEEMIKLLEENGGKIAIDDFGSGYSNESILITISPDFVKIDMSLIRDIDKDSHKQQLVTNIIEYTRNNGIKTIAQGVENLDEMKALISLRVDYLQGFYLGKPFNELVDITDKIKEEILFMRI